MLDETKSAITKSLSEKLNAEIKLGKGNSDRNIIEIRNVCNWKNRSTITAGLYELTYMTFQPVQYPPTNTRIINKSFFFFNLSSLCVAQFYVYTVLIIEMTKSRTNDI